MNTSNGQTLLELIIVFATVVIIVGALAFAVIASIRNASFAKNEAQATKLAQEGLERLRSGRDRNNAISGNFILQSATVTDWQDPDLWRQVDGNCGNSLLNPPTYCFFKFTSATSGGITFIGVGSDIPSTAEAIPNTQFLRAITLSDSSASCTREGISCYTVEKIATVIVRWRDPSGTHESKLTTILRRL